VLARVDFQRLFELRNRLEVRLRRKCNFLAGRRWVQGKGEVGKGAQSRCIPLLQDPAGDERAREERRPSG
jgi:hypothetical protein